jgi:hypothetical protein
MPGGDGDRSEPPPQERKRSDSLPARPPEPSRARPQEIAEALARATAPRREPARQQ